MTQEGKDRVRVTGVKGKRPPTTTRVGVTAKGGYQAQFSFYLVGLDLEQKAEWTKVCKEEDSDLSQGFSMISHFIVEANLVLDGGQHQKVLRIEVSSCRI